MWQMEQEGYTEQELDDLEAARNEEQGAQQQTLATALTNAQRNFDQNGNGAQGAPAVGVSPNGTQA
jgi:hemoglobin-like flavoprotein